MIAYTLKIRQNVETKFSPVEILVCASSEEHLNERLRVRGLNIDRWQIIRKEPSDTLFILNLK